jgi:hypothetical protein
MCGLALAIGQLLIIMLHIEHIQSAVLGHKHFVRTRTFVRRMTGHRIL